MRKLLYLIFLFSAFGFSQPWAMKRQASWEQANGDYRLTIPGLISLWTENTIDATATIEGDDVDDWGDVEGSNDATNTGTPSPELHLTAGSVRQVTFDGSDVLLVQADGGDLDFTPGTDAFWILVKIGDNITSNSGCLFCKSQGTAVNRQYQLAVDSSDKANLYVGGQNIDNDFGTIVANTFIIVQVNTGDVDAWLDGTQGINGVTLTGTNTSTDSVFIGGRTGGFNPDIDIAWLAIGSGTLSGTVISELNALYDEN